MKFIHPVEALPFLKLVDINGQRRAVFPCARAAGGAFELDTDILVDGPVILDDGGVDVGPLGLLEALNLPRRELYTQAEDFSTVKVGIGVIHG